jgi:uncharacterized protein (TIGR03118 family)
MPYRSSSNVLLAGIVIVLAVVLGPGPSFAEFVQTNLVSDIPGLAANTDPNLKNPWGISLSSSSPFWVSDQVTGVSTLYNGSGTPQPLVVTIPGGNPTGQVFNTTASDFSLPVGGKAFFLFSTLGGNIVGWNPGSGTSGQVAGGVPVASYTGLALANNGSANFLYAANSLAATINVYNSTFQATTLAGSFTDPNLPAGFTPYNIQNIGGTLYVTYENEDDGGGVVNAFDANGNFLRRISANAAGGPLAAPWGLALAPPGFGPFGGALLVGNEDDGHIGAFDPLTGTFLGQLLGQNGLPIANTGLWGLTFGNGGKGGDPGTLYFAAGIQGEEHGLFGSLQFVVPGPASLALIAPGLALLAGAAWRAGARTRATQRRHGEAPLPS